MRESDSNGRADVDPLRVGIVGGSFIGTTVGAGFRDHSEARIIGLVDIDEPPLHEAGSELGVAPAGRYTDYETMLVAEPTLDAVLIGTPHTLHYDQILDAFDAGLHVLCDKPLTTDLEQAKRLVELDRQREQTLMVGYQRHLDPSFIKARELWATEGREPRWITADVCQEWVEPFSDTWRQKPTLSGGGYLYDTGSHLLGRVLWATRLTPETVSATMILSIPTSMSTVVVLLRFGSRTATFSFSGEVSCCD